MVKRDVEGNPVPKSDSTSAGAQGEAQQKKDAHALRNKLGLAGDPPATAGLPPSDEEISKGSGASVEQWMAEVIPCVHHHLLLHLIGIDEQEDLANPLQKPLHEHAPLAIVADTTATVKNFKEPWNSKNCVDALTTTDLYEASGSIFWLDTLEWQWLSASTERVAHNVSHVNWAQLRTAKSNWSEATFVNSAVDNERMRRWTFPGVYPTMVAGVAEARRGATSGRVCFAGLPLLAGHAMVWAWYWEMLEALQALAEERTPSATRRIFQLYEAALTITIRMRAGPSLNQVLLDSCRWSESVRGMYNACADSFVTLCQKLRAMPSLKDDFTNAPKLMRALSQQGVTFQNKEIGINQCKAALAVTPFLESAEVLRDLQSLEECFPGLVSEQTKFMRLCQVVTKIVPWRAGGDRSQDLLSHILQALLSLLRQGWASDEDVSVPWLVGDKDNAGFAQAVAKRRSYLKWINDELRSKSAGLTDAGRQELTRVREIFADPRSFDKEFVLPSIKVQETGNTMDTELRDKRLAEWQATLTTPAMVSLSQMFFGVYATSFDTEFGKLCNDETIHFGAYLQEDKDPEPASLAEAYQSFLELWCAKPISLQRQAPVEAGTGGGGVQVVPGEVDSDMADQRQELLNLCSKHRSNVKLFPLRAPGAPSVLADLYKPVGSKLTEHFKQCAKGAGKRVQGETQNILILLNTETFNVSHQILAHSLHSTPVPFHAELNHAWSWLEQMANEQTAVVMVSDGRNKDIRRKLETWFDKCFPDESRGVELWITYGAKGPSADQVRGPRRKVAFSANNRETLWVGLPEAKVKVKSKSRHGFGACGEDSTHNVTYSNVPVRPLTSLPRLCKEDKEKMIGGRLANDEGKETLKKEFAKGHPLFWQEMKPISLLSTLFEDFGACRVFDLSPGSGAAAIACVYNGIAYDGVCANTDHQRWLDNILDMATLAVLSGEEVPVPKQAVLSGEEVPVPKQVTVLGKENGAMIKQYFATAVAEAKRFMREGSGDNQPKEDDAASEDEDDDDE